jgi:hypothetical protein
MLLIWMAYSEVILPILLGRDQAIGQQVSKARRPQSWQSALGCPRIAPFQIQLTQFLGLIKPFSYISYRRTRPFPVFDRIHPQAICRSSNA